MSVDISALGLDRLSVDERLQVIEQLWNTLPASVGIETMPSWHRQVVADRRSQIDATPDDGRPWREVVDRLQQ